MLLTSPSLFGASIAVRLYNYAAVPNEPLTRARKEGARILAHAGVTARWVDCPVSAADANREQACSQPLSDRELVLKLLPRSLAEKFNRQPGTFGFAAPASRAGLGTAIVFVHESEQLARYGSFPLGFEITRAVILGHLMAHEIGHLLLGPGSHSQTGIMSFPWTASVLTRVAWGNLFFTSRQTRLIRERLGAGQEHDVANPMESDR